MKSTHLRTGRLRRLLGAVAGAALLLSSGPPARAEETYRLQVVGGLGGVSQYTRFEEPFWRERVPALTQGRVTAEITPLDRSGHQPAAMLRLMGEGTVPFGTALLPATSSEEPEFDALDLPGLNPDLESLRRTVRLYRPHLRRLLRERYGIELLAVFTYPAQVIWCRQPFAGLGDLAGRRIRTSSVSQGEFLQTIGARSVSVPFAGIGPAMKEDRIDCAVTGAMSGLSLGLQEVAGHIHSMALNWGISAFGANQDAWRALPPPVRDALGRGLEGLERDIWDSVGQETRNGLDCATNRPGCDGDRRGHLALVPVTPADEVLRRSLLLRTVLPRWVDRCGPECADAWNSSIAPAIGIRAVPH